MKKTIFIVSFLALIITQTNAQSKAPEIGKILSKENAIVGGNVTLPLASILQGQKDISLGANPYFGYEVSKNVDVAVVLNLQKNKYEITQTSILNLINNQSTTKVSMLGVGAFTKLYILDLAFLQFQPEINYVTINETTYTLNGINLPIASNSKKSIVKPSFLVGAGYKRNFNKGKTYYYASLLYDLMGEKSPYSNGIASIVNNNKTTPIVLRAGVNFKLSDFKK